MFNWRKRVVRDIIEGQSMFCDPTNRDLHPLEKAELKTSFENYDCKLTRDYLSELCEAQDLVEKIPGQTFDLKEFLNVRLNSRGYMRDFNSLDQDFYWGFVFAEYYISKLHVFYTPNLFGLKNLMSSENFYNLLLNTEVDDAIDPKKNLTLALAVSPPEDTLFVDLLSTEQRLLILERYCNRFKSSSEFYSAWGGARLLASYPASNLLLKQYFPNV